MTMKLYVWSDCLCDYNCGKIFAMAENVAQAREVVLKRGRKKEPWRMAALMAGIAGRPKVYRRPAADWQGGGG